MALKQLDINGFCDLNITSKPDDKLLSRIIEFNYKAIALNWTVDATKINKPSKKKKGASATKNDSEDGVVIFPKELSESFANIISLHADKLKVFLRITIIFSTQDQLKSVLTSPGIKKYDIIAALPTTNAAYQIACTHNSIDLISFEIGVTDYKPNGKMHKQLVSRSGYYEIQYSQALKSSAKRQETITTALYYFIYGKSKNVIISSGASHYLDLRNPYDAAHISILFGLSTERGNWALSRNCRLLLLAAAGRRYGKTAIVVERIDEDTQPSGKRTSKSTSGPALEVAIKRLKMSESIHSDSSSSSAD